MPWLLNAAYLVTLFAVSPLLLYASVRHGKYREGWREKLLGLVPRSSGNRACVWMHAVSVGEVNLLAPLLEEIERQQLEWEFVISSTTKTGYDLARKKYAHCQVFYCPLDFSWAVRRAVRRLRPQLLILAELELWPNLIAAAKEQGAQIAIVNGRLSAPSCRGYRRLGRLLTSTLARLDLVAAQDQTSYDRFCQIGVNPASLFVSGSLKFDGAPKDRDNPLTRQLAELAGIQATDLVFLAGSTQAPEEQFAVETFRQLSARFPQLKLILVPRHPQRFDEVAQLLDHSSFEWQRRSLLADHPTRARILLVDTIGELSAWWGTARIAFVGGSMGKRGGQNMIEPAAFGAAVSFGPNTRNFRDIVEQLLVHDAAMVVPSSQHLTEFVERCLCDSEFRESLGRRAERFVESQRGATQRTLAALRKLLEDRTDVVSLNP